MYFRWAWNGSCEHDEWSAADGRGEGDLCVFCHMHRVRGHKLPHGGRNQQGSEHERRTIPEASEKFD